LPVCTAFEDIDYINSNRRTVHIFGGTQVEKHLDIEVYRGEKARGKQGVPVLMSPQGIAFKNL